MATKIQKSKLEELSRDCESKSALVLQLQENLLWQHLINQKEIQLDESTIHVFFQIFGKCLSSRLHKHTQQDIVDEILYSKFIDIDLLKLFENLFTNPITDSQRIEDSLGYFVTFLEDLLQFKFELAKLQPIIDLCSNYMKSNTNSCSELLAQKFDRVQKQHQQRANYTSKDIEMLGCHKEYKYMRILPSASELTNPNCYTRTVASDTYMNFDHYIDTQFSILRNDLIEPLKSNIQQFLRQSDAEQQDNLEVYKNVQINTLFNIENGTIICKLNFDIRPFKHVDLVNSRKLSVRSLLCLSADAFKTVTYAVVHSREQVDQGILCVKFINDQGEECEHDHFERLNLTYMMVESPGYCEIYCCMLKGLSSLDLTKHDYLISAEPSIALPNHLKQKTVYDFSCLRSLSDIYDGPREELSNVNVVDFSNWPDTELNPEQQIALHKALICPVSLIQAPPGTGNLFMCLKIVETLLHNVGEIHKEPILVVFANGNTLDQFLKEVHVNTEIRGAIGIGGNSSQTMHDHIIDIAKQTKLDKSKNFQSILEIENELRLLRKSSFELDLHRYCKGSYVMHETLLQDLTYPDDHLIKIITSASYNKNSRKSALFSWLGLFSDVKAYTNLFRRKCEFYQSNGNLTEKSEDPRNEESTSEHEPESKPDFNKQYFIKHLKVKSISDPFYMYNVEEYRNVDIKDITDIATKTGVKYIKTHTEEIKAALKKNRSLCEQELRKTDTFSLNAAQMPDVLNMELPERWKLYRRWIQAREYHLQKTVTELKEKYGNRKYHEIISQIAYDVLRSKKVIGITADAAVRLLPILQEIGCKFIIVKDAAQLLESQITSLLTPETQNLVLIGDNQQLAPTVVSESIQKETKLNVTLVERLIKNKVPTTTLKRQYRMRPEISKLLKHIYPELIDDPSVFHLPSILGIKNNVFFVDIQHQSSEGNFIVGLYKYLLQQGYNSHQITVLPPDFSQALDIQQCISKWETPTKIPIVTPYHFLDRYSVISIILLDHNNADWFEDKESIITALSCANLGIYLIGRFDLLDKSSYWHDILVDMQEKQLVGTVLPLVCQRHPQTQTMITTAEDFSALAPRGGCLEDCQTVYSCGHQCTFKCHNGEHSKIVKGCTKWCEQGIPCAVCVLNKFTNLPCGHDKTSSDQTITAEETGFRCCHVLRYQRPVCSKVCDYRLDCGHRCHLKCHTAEDQVHIEPMCKKNCNISNSSHA